jgi:hypothetical protein
MRLLTSSTSIFSKSSCSDFLDLETPVLLVPVDLTDLTLFPDRLPVAPFLSNFYISLLPSTKPPFLAATPALAIIAAIEFPP